MDGEKDRTCQFTAESRCKHQNNRDKVSETDCGGGRLEINCLKGGGRKRAGTKGIRLSVGGGG